MAANVFYFTQVVVQLCCVVKVAVFSNFNKTDPQHRMRDTAEVSKIKQVKSSSEVFWPVVWQRIDRNYITSATVLSQNTSDIACIMHPEL